MLSFFKRNKPGKEVPEWANYFSKKEYEKFIEQLDTYFRDRNITYSFGDGEINVEEKTFGAERLGLVNLAQMCKQMAQSDWRDIIKEHFDGMQTAAIFEEEFNYHVDDFDFARGYIGVRLYHNDYVSNLDKSLMIGRQITDDIFAMLVFDFPQGIVNVKPEQTIQWNKSNEELFDIGVENIRVKYETEIVSQRIGDFNIWIAQGEHFFVPNIIFDFQNNQKFIGTNGSLIAIPHRHCVLIYPIENLQVIKSVNQLIPIIYSVNEEGPGSISNNLYWYNNGQFITLPYKFENNKVQFYPPEDFIEMLSILKANI